MTFFAEIGRAKSLARNKTLPAKPHVRQLNLYLYIPVAHNLTPSFALREVSQPKYLNTYSARAGAMGLQYAIQNASARSVVTEKTTPQAPEL